MDSRSHKTFGLVGREVWSERECTRDTEWKLVQVIVIMHAGSTPSLLLHMTSYESSFETRRLMQEPAQWGYSARAGRRCKIDETSGAHVRVCAA